MNLCLPRNTTQYVIPGTKFYRLASRKLLNRWGTNLQNVEKGIRKLYWADDGRKLCQVDQAGAEALIVAYLTRHGLFRDLFLNGIKSHVFVALHVFPEEWQREINSSGLHIKCDIKELLDCSIAELTRHPFWKEINELIRSSDNWEPSRRYYYMAKQICHSSNYGIEANMFCLNTLEKSRGKIALKKRDAERFLSLYHSLFPEIHELHLEIERQVKNTRLLFNLLGDPIYFSGDLEIKSTLKEMYSAIPQSTVACINRTAVTKFQNFVETTGIDWDFLQDNHDSFLTQCPEEEDIECCRIMRQFIEQDLVSPRGEKFKMKSEAASGYNWAPYKEKDNPLGLREINL